MERWKNRVAVVTGASAGIGAACVKYLANNGMIVVGLARRKECIEALRDQVEASARDRLHGLQCDLRDQQQIIDVFKVIVSKYGPIAVLVNNAGVLRNTNLVNDDNQQDIQDVIDTNIVGVVNCTREAFRSMKAHGGVGHVFLINSICGHNVPKAPNFSLNIYPCTKHAVTAMTEVYRHEFHMLGTKVKVTSISPGTVNTEIILPKMKEILADAPFLQPEDVAEALIYCLQTPPHVQLHLDEQAFELLPDISVERQQTNRLILSGLHQNMERWQNRVAVVTGASAGIGAACVKYLANNGMIVVGLARRKERIEALRDQVEATARDRVHAMQCDMRVHQQIIDAFKVIVAEYGPVAVLVNNAGIVRIANLVDDNNLQEVQDVIDTNIVGVVNCTREAFRSMKAHGGVGHVFLINSIFGHFVANIPNISINMYACSKHAMTAMTEVYRQEFYKLGTKIKVTSISPGVVDTEILTPKVREIMNNTPPLKSEDIADALIYCLQTPPHVQIHEMIIKHVGELF
ncbi:uncharacterized protein LOC105213965 [Zeugodacus cucurbitae]|nr:uncharacterized protein LOC105213965 [Zeugodacus cucurbitae]